MSDPASYGFLPWSRRGLSSLARTAGSTNYLSVSLSMTVNSTAVSPVSVRLYGPGQVAGLDARTIARTEPAANTATFEPNYFPAIEFATPDLPWLFSPTVPAGALLKPWLCLVVVREQAGVTLVQRGQGLPLLQFEAPAVPLDELPNLDQIAAWAHAQIAGGATSDDAIRTALDGPPAGSVSRIICPRRLQPATSYIACVVPTYRAGVNVGTSPGIPVDDNDIAPAWDATVTAPFALPVYTSWRFATSSDGDFASLVARLRAAGPLQLGAREMDISAPGFGLPIVAGATLGLEGALKSTETASTVWPAAQASAFQAALRQVLAPAPADVPIVTPPTYGDVPAGSALPADNANPLWMRQLNLDPRWRAVAGMGRAIVSAAREALMASAWDQFEAVRRANQTLRQLQLAREVTGATRTRQFGAVDAAGTLLQMTRPLHARLRLTAAALTLNGQIAESRVAPGAVSAAFRRLTRRRGPIGRVLYTAGSAPSRIVERLNDVTGITGALVVAAPRVPPIGTVLLDAVATQTTIAKLEPTVVNAAAGWSIATTVTTETPVTPVLPVTVERLATPAAQPSLRPIGSIPTIPVKSLPTFPKIPIDRSGQLEMARRFKLAAGAITTYISTRTTKFTDAPARPPLAAQLSDVQSLAFAAVDPAITIVPRARARLTLPTTGDPLRPLLGLPTFPQAMSSELEPRQLLPGVEQMLPDRVALLVTNPQFVESFMVGLNDEMRREFAWRQYPCDQRGTFFSQFWSSAAAGVPADIPAIATWNAAAALGANATQTGAQVVLLIRGELLRRYPNAIVSAVPAQGAGTARTLGTTELLPIFRGSIDPDMVFFGFPLTAAAATAGAGYYFVISEHPTEPRFGFEPAAKPGTLATWNDLAWPQVAVAHNHVDLSAPAPSVPLENAAWNANSAAQAYITFRRPVRVALHATAILE
jgi:hypothetical protein